MLHVHMRMWRISGAQVTERMRLKIRAHNEATLNVFYSLRPAPVRIHAITCIAIKELEHRVAHHQRHGFA